MERYKYRKIDAFTSAVSNGNPAACIYLNPHQSLSDEQMLQIAKQHKGFVSEVVFCSQKDESEFDLAFFSSECEVAFCGHGTIACMYSIIKDTPDLLFKKEIKINTRKKGALTVYNKIAEENAVFISATKPEYLDMNLGLADICDYLELDISAISTDYPVEFIDAGNKTLIVPVAKLEDEINLFPNEQRLKDFTLNNGIDVILIFCRDTKDKTSIAHTRVFAPKFGYLEDPATGSANSAYGYYMLKNNMWSGNMITLEQGGSDRIFNTIYLSRNDGALLFGGSATTRIDGYYYI
ncbi:MAG TPA: PhzF family phenazine biosynthesis isomerase [Oscillospiraceae bacterium]|nr:PhzF family phenazine biosynthesis isomerase [Oscillospiraceae bacterium]HPF56982.1 PhzF family phenazine biosynthesis isomerase [Clostridiales bacterium]HPK35531.1 PhzF family phenazine biosynthesis isomerase [Oscillospiraceae bacterium]HPR75666.1 PhzF family phenazine biosynthesis isomerase [Oscillospiraceae bacterium]